MNVIVSLFLILSPADSTYFYGYFAGQSIGYKDTTIFDFDAGVALSVRMCNGLVIDTENIIPLSSFNLQQEEGYVKGAFFKYKAGVEQTQSQGQGIIPTIEVPMTFPKSLSFLGEGGRLDINGQQDVTLEGTSHYASNTPYGDNTNKSFDPHLDQNLNVRLMGTVGSKLSVSLDYNGKRENSSDNKIKLTYRGGEDEVVQLIEAGDTKLSLPSTRFASFPGGSKSGLFGIRGEFNFAGLKIQAVASREKGEQAEGTVTGGATRDTVLLYDRDYAKGKFFYLQDSDSIVHIDVFLHDNLGAQGSQSDEIYRAVFYYYDPVTFTFDSAYREESQCRLLNEQEDYIFHYDSKILEMKNQVTDGSILGVHYITASGREVGYVSSSTDSTNILRVVRPSRYMTDANNLVDKQDTLLYRVFNNELKYIYDFGETHVSPEDVELRILRDSLGTDEWVEGEGGKTYLHLLGLDQNNDGKIDPYININGKVYTVFDGLNGYIIFPYALPFISDSLNDPDSIIYTKPMLRENEGMKYKLVFVIKKKTSVIHLNQMNIIEGSERVTYNGQVLQKGTQYTIDYQSGIVTLIDTSILNDPNAQVNVTYDYAPFLIAKPKSVYGVRMDYNIGDNFTAGASLFGRSESNIDRKPRLGSEPTRSFLTETDLTFKQDMAFLSNLLNKLRFGKSDALSNIKLQGEIARSAPNLNTNGYAYLEDMEQSKREDELPVDYLRWKIGSRPVLTNGQYADTGNLASSLIWFTRSDLFSNGDIYENLTEDEKRQPASVLLLDIKPHNSDTASYASLSTLLNDAGTDESDMEYLEVIIKGDSGKFHIDIGPDVSEDAIWRDRQGTVKGFHNNSTNIDSIDTEDKNHDNIFEAKDEDTGLDGVFGSDGSWGAGSSDDGNDDYTAYNSKTGNYSGVDGTEKNGRFDTEELKADLILDTMNSYFEYTIDLSNLNDTNLVSVNAKGFKHYLIPLKNPYFYRKFGNPDFENIRVSRMWIDGIDKESEFYIADMSIVGNKWQNIGVFTTDSLNPVDTTIEKIGVYTVGVRNNSAYTTPQGVYVERDPLTGKLQEEHSLAFKYSNIQPGHYGVVRYYTLQNQDFLSYRKIEVFVRPNPAISPPYPELALRFGDTLNYYEYRIKFTTNEWKKVDIDMDSLAQFKKSVSDTAQLGIGKFYTNGTTGIMGNPNFTAVRDYSIVLINDTTSALGGEVWIDELRLAAPRNDPGTAYRFSTELSLSDIAKFDYTREYLSENFKPLVGAGRRDRSVSDNFSASANFGKFLPPKWGLNLATSYQRSNQLSYPKYETGTDVLLNEKQKQKEITKSSNRSYRLNVGLSTTGSRVINILLVPFSFSASRAKGLSLSPTSFRNTYTDAANASYNYNPKFDFKVLGITFKPLPTNISSGASFSHSDNLSRNYTSGSITHDTSKTLTYRYGVQYGLFKNFTTSYSRSTSRDLFWGNQKWGTESGMQESFSTGYSLNVFGIISPSASFTGRYNEQSTRQMQVDSSMHIMNVSNSGNISLGSQIGLKKMLNAVASLRQESQDTAPKTPWNYLLLQLHNLTNLFGDPRVTYSINRTSSYRTLEKRPSRSYRLGIDDVTGSEMLDPAQVQKTPSNNFQVQGALTFPFLNLNYRYGYVDSRNYTYTSAAWSRNRTWPSLTGNLTGVLNKFFKSSKFMSNPSLSFTYTVSEQQSGIIGDSLKQVSTTRNLMPQFNVNFFRKINLSSNFNWNKSSSESQRGVPQTTTSEDRSVNSSLSYSFSSPSGIKLPFGRIHIRNQATISISNTYTKSLQNRKDGTTGEVTPLKDMDMLSFVLTIAYNFSRDINGSLSFRKTSNNNNQNGSKTSDTSLSANATFTF